MCSLLTFYVSTFWQCDTNSSPSLAWCSKKTKNVSKHFVFCTSGNNFFIHFFVVKFVSNNLINYWSWNCESLWWGLSIREVPVLPNLPINFSFQVIINGSRSPWSFFAMNICTYFIKKSIPVRHICINHYTFTIYLTVSEILQDEIFCVQKPTNRVHFTIGGIIDRHCDKQSSTTTKTTPVETWNVMMVYWTTGQNG